MSIPVLLLAILQVYSWLILARVVMSWVNPDPRNDLLIMVIKVTEPVLGPLRGMVSFGGMDFSPILAYLLIRILMRIVSVTGI
ncbi:hypothetical protein CSA17_00855 [bacterium DOLJORAL78_65_58]|nr:MAG: hypothetical protein CSB20_08780 [bacterium DOLZORAL124_64_63]PIE76695.1 MAG: hypothetical protein CSA17_00855 [bacterium DOLJORAL78_65_58]